MLSNALKMKKDKYKYVANGHKSLHFFKTKKESEGFDIISIDYFIRQIIIYDVIRSVLKDEDQDVLEIIQWSNSIHVNYCNDRANSVKIVLFDLDSSNVVKVKSKSESKISVNFSTSCDSSEILKYSELINTCASIAKHIDEEYNKVMF